jgi:hypothetical protein
MYVGHSLLSSFLFFEEGARVMGSNPWFKSCSEGLTHSLLSNPLSPKGKPKRV